MVSNSESPAGSWSDSRRSVCGMSTSRSFIELTPIVSSIADRSSGERTRYGNLVGGRLSHCLVVSLVEQVRRRVAGEVELADPRLAIWGCGRELGPSREPLDRRRDPT